MYFVASHQLYVENFWTILGSAGQLYGIFGLKTQVDVSRRRGHDYSCFRFQFCFSKVMAQNINGNPGLTTYNPRVEPEFVIILTLTARLEFVLIYPGIRLLTRSLSTNKAPDICGKQLSTFNDIIFNLLLISLAKVRVKEPVLWCVFCMSYRTTISRFGYDLRVHLP